MDMILRAVTKDGAIRMYAADTTELVSEAAEKHQMNATAAAALGRLLTGAAMMGSMLKGEKDSVTLQVNGGGPIGKLIAVSNFKGEVKGYADVPYIDLPLNSVGKLDVGGAVGKNGLLTVIRDLGLKEPYVGQVPLVSGEIAEDLTMYFAQSEQVPSAVALGVLVNPDLSVRQSGGFIIQMMPDATEEHITKLEQVLSELPPITEMQEQGMTPKEIILTVLSGMDVEFLDERTPRYHCDCSKERMERALVSLGEIELEKMIADGKGAELTCHFCNFKHSFTHEDLILLKERAVSKK